LNSSSAILISGHCIFGLRQCNPGKCALFLRTLPEQILVSVPCIFRLCWCNFVLCHAVQYWYALHAWNLPMLFRPKFVYLSEGSQSWGCVASVYFASHISAVENVLTLRTCSTVFCIPLSRILPCDCKLGWLLLCLSVTNSLLFFFKTQRNRGASTQYPTRSY
jgi:hypothetical protein